MSCLEDTYKYFGCMKLSEAILFVLGIIGIIIGNYIFFYVLINGVLESNGKIL